MLKQRMNDFRMTFSHATISTGIVKAKDANYSDGMISRRRSSAVNIPMIDHKQDLKAKSFLANVNAN